VNLSQRFSALWTGGPWELYRRLRSVNPAPFAAFLDFGRVAVLSASPERFLQRQGDLIETRPIKGTRPRGGTPEEDRSLGQELATSAKDRAEHIMIVDLERSDLGRVAQTGTVTVDELMALESYATVHHLTSTVRGRLRPDRTLADLLRATFPGGSITGAPKIRAMEIIDELEPVRRGVYTGAIGYFSATGDLDLSIAIRTLVLNDGVAHFQVGGGIVYDSDPEAEYRETLDKGRALFQALAGG
ncbi:MAG: aminodeoxychorismate synthase component I, partial [Dehalococcoidia bacterium]